MAYTELKHVAIWVKTNSGMGSFYRNSYEVVLIFKHGKGRHCNNILLGKFGRHRSDVWTYPSPNSFAGRRTDEGNPLEWHARPQPVGPAAAGAPGAPPFPRGCPPQIGRRHLLPPRPPTY